MKKIYISMFIIAIGLVVSNSLSLESKRKVFINYGNDRLMVSIDGEVADKLPSDGNYYLTAYSCTNPNTKVSWNNTSRELMVSNGEFGGNVACDLEFESKPLLSKMPMGSYVKYVGIGGSVGEEELVCEGNSCLGENANEGEENTYEDLYGYCYDSNYKYYTTGFRIGYINNNKVMLVSAGGLECISYEESEENTKFISILNTRALKYCNSNFTSGTCSCEDIDGDSLCDNPSLDVWALNDRDFYHISYAISGNGKRLTQYSSDLGVNTGKLNLEYCYTDNKTMSSYRECGYDNDILDNGGFYWFAAKNGMVGMSGSLDGVFWSPNYRGVRAGSDKNTYGFRPVISLAESVYVISGDGTVNNPYVIGN